MIGVLRATPNDLSVPFREGGGDDYWMWRGEKSASEARLEVVVEPTFWSSARPPLRYSLAYDTIFSPYINKEIVEDERPRKGKDATECYLKRGSDKIGLTYQADSGGRSRRELPSKDFASFQSILAQLKDPSQYPELTTLGRELARIQIYQEWSFGRNTPPRLAQKADLPNDSLSEDGKNLGMVLNRIEGNPKAKKQLLTALRQLYHGIDDYYVQVEAGSVQVFIKEGNVPISRRRGCPTALSATFACSPSCVTRGYRHWSVSRNRNSGSIPTSCPAWRTCCAKPPSAASSSSPRTRIPLVDALTETPESIVVCEKENGQTKLKRLDKDDLSHWLEKYRLGELWTSGELGGNRW